MPEKENVCKDITMQNSDTKPRDKTSQNDQAVAKADAENNSPENLTSRRGKRHAHKYRAKLDTQYGVPLAHEMRRR